MTVQIARPEIKQVFMESETLFNVENGAHNWILLLEEGEVLVPFQASFESPHSKQGVYRNEVLMGGTQGGYKFSTHFRGQGGGVVCKLGYLLVASALSPYSAGVHVETKTFVVDLAATVTSFECNPGTFTAADIGAWVALTTADGVYLRRLQSYSGGTGAGGDDQLTFRPALPAVVTVGSTGKCAKTYFHTGDAYGTGANKSLAFLGQAEAPGLLALYLGGNGDFVASIEPKGAKPTCKIDWDFKIASSQILPAVAGIVYTADDNRAPINLAPRTRLHIKAYAGGIRSSSYGLTSFSKISITPGNGLVELTTGNNENGIGGHLVGGADKAPQITATVLYDPDWLTGFKAGTEYDVMVQMGSSQAGGMGAFYIPRARIMQEPKIVKDGAMYYELVFGAQYNDDATSGPPVNAVDQSGFQVVIYG